MSSSSPGGDHSAVARLENSQGNSAEIAASTVAQALPSQSSSMPFTARICSGPSMTAPKSSRPVTSALVSDRSSQGTSTAGQLKLTSHAWQALQDVPSSWSRS